MKWLTLAVLLVGCGPSQSFNINGYSLPVRDQLFLTRPQGYFCTGFAPDQLQFQLADYAPSCYLDQGNASAYDPNRDHTRMDIVVALSANPTYGNGTHPPFTFDNTADCTNGGADSLATFYHFPAGPIGGQPDMTIQADSGSIRIFSYDMTFKTATTGDFTLTFGSNTITGTLNALNCD